MTWSWKCAPGISAPCSWAPTSGLAGTRLSPLPGPVSGRRYVFRSAAEAALDQGTRKALMENTSPVTLTLSVTNPTEEERDSIHCIGSGYAAALSALQPTTPGGFRPIARAQCRGMPKFASSTVNSASSTAVAAPLSTVPASQLAGGDGLVSGMVTPWASDVTRFVPN